MSGARSRKVMACLGTRPEVIKLAPVVARLRDTPGLEPVVVATAQHRELLDQILADFALSADVDLDLMRPRQTLAELTGRAVGALARALDDVRPDAVIVQGDTTTAMCGALAAYYAGIPLGHVEAGLRTDDLRAPFPEEANRRIVTVLARWHWAPTAAAAATLLAEGVPSGRIYMTGNPVVDALHAIAAQPVATGHVLALPRHRRRRMLVTIHRRETQGEAQRELFRMLARLARERDDLEVVFPVHRNPVVREVAESELRGVPGVELLDPLTYHQFIHLMRTADFILTDSGGIQEEAPTFAIPVLVARDTTERPEIIEAGCARLSGTTPAGVEADVRELLDDDDALARMRHAANPYGDGRAAERIVEVLDRDLVGASVAA